MPVAKRLYALQCLNVPKSVAESRLNVWHYHILSDWKSNVGKDWAES